MPYFMSPVEGRVSSQWGPRVHPITGVNGFHRGIDIAAPVGTPIVAAYGGIVRFTRTDSHRGDRSRNKITGTWNTGNLVIIDGPGGGTELYGHLDKVLVKAGDRVNAGDRIGTVGMTGNVTGPHLHFECWNGRSQGGGVAGPGNTRDPRSDFAKYGVTPGKPGSGGKAPKKSAKKADSKVLRVQRILAPMGYYQGALDGIPGPFYKAGVDAYHRAQRYMPGVKRDRVWGPATEAHYGWTKRLQGALREWGAVQRLPVPPAIDGDYAEITDRAVYVTQRDNHGRAYRGALDRIPGPVFCRMLKISPHPGL